MAYRVIATANYDKVLRYFKEVEKNLGKEHVVGEASPICIFVSNEVPEVVVQQITQMYDATYKKV